MGIFDITPSVRLDTEAFNNALKELNLSKAEFNSQLRKAGVSLRDQRSKTNYLNRLLKDAGLGTSYKNVISSSPSKTLTTKGQVEVGMGGERPGQRGAPNNAKIWSDGAKVQKRAEKLFKTVKEQRKYFVDTMQKIYKNIPKKQILDLFKNVVKGIKTTSPMGIMSELAMDMIEKNPELMTIMPGNENAKPQFYNKGGMMDINKMIKPLGYSHGGLHEETKPEVGTFAEKRSLLDRINDFFKYQRKDPERFFGGADGMEFHLDDLSLIEFIKRRAGTEDENSPEYRDELMKFMEEVTPKKNMGGIISLSGGKY